MSPEEKLHAERLDELNARARRHAEEEAAKEGKLPPSNRGHLAGLEFGEKPKNEKTKALEEL